MTSERTNVTRIIQRQRGRRRGGETASFARRISWIQLDEPDEQIAPVAHIEREREREKERAGRYSGCCRKMAVGPENSI